MDQATARKLFKEGAIFLFLDVPEGTEFGIDMKSWNTGEKFRGVKMIPPGVHYIFYSSVTSTGDTAPRTGFFHNFKSGEILARKWDKENDDMSLDEVPENDIVSLKDNIHALDQFLGPYPYEIAERWISLTSHIHDNLIRILMPQCGKVRSALELIACSDLDRPKGNKIIDHLQSPSTSKDVKRSRITSPEEILDSYMSNLKPTPGTALQFTTLPTEKYPDNATPSEITKHCMDLTYTLETLLKNYSNSMDLLGEMEVAYICFLVGHSLEAFEHWKEVVSLVCSCEDAVPIYQSLYDDFISILELHVKEIPEEFLADIVTNNNFVYMKLRQFFRTVLTSIEVGNKLKTKVKRFQKKLTESYSWDFSHLESEDEDDLPVIVET